MSRRRRPDRRGNNRDRAARKRWLLRTFGGVYGGVMKVPCHHCGKPLLLNEVEADRIIPGGSYRRDNIIPSCRRCNASRGNKPLDTWAGLAK